MIAHGIDFSFLVRVCSGSLMRTPSRASGLFLIAAHSVMFAFVRFCLESLSMASADMSFHTGKNSYRGTSMLLDLLDQQQQPAATASSSSSRNSSSNSSSSQQIQQQELRHRTPAPVY